MFLLIRKLVVLILIVPISLVLAKRFKRIRWNVQTAGDKRLKLTNELINGIRFVKFYAWENPFLKNILRARESELVHTIALGVNRSYVLLITSNSNTIIVALIFIFYSLVGGNELTPQVAFATLSVLNLLRVPFLLVSFSLTIIQQYRVVLERVARFVERPEVTVERNESLSNGKTETLKSNEVLKFKKAAFKWDPENDNPTIRGLDFSVRKGELVSVVGSVGTGKSTLCMSILGEVPMVKGERHLMEGKVAYVPQEAWIFNASVRENILFGNPWDPERYRAVLEATALGPDLTLLALGDRTEIGERGINLSGGQKQRVSIARSLYSDADIYLLDDPLSAVDAHVGKHIFQRAIRSFLQEKTVILVTNQLQYVPETDKVMVIRKGKMEAFGPYEELLQSSPTLKEMMDSLGTTEKEEDNSKHKDIEEVKATYSRLPERVKAAEEKESGLVSLSIYGYYILMGGLFMFSIIILFNVVGTASFVVSSWWLARWTSGELSNFSVGALVGRVVTFL